MKLRDADRVGNSRNWQEEICCSERRGDEDECEQSREHETVQTEEGIEDTKTRKKLENFSFSFPIKVGTVFHLGRLTRSWEEMNLFLFGSCHESSQVLQKSNCNPTTS